MVRPHPRIVRLGLLAVLPFLVVLIGGAIWLRGGRTVSTEDAYVKADLAQVAPVLQVCEIRSIAADELWLSPNFQRDSVALHFTWIADTDAVLPVVGAIEAQLAPLAARPHWGKVFTTAPASLRTLYPRFSSFAGLAASFDPEGVFRNEWLDAVLA